MQAGFSLFFETAVHAWMTHAESSIIPTRLGFIVVHQPAIEPQYIYIYISNYLSQAVHLKKISATFASLHTSKIGMDNPLAAFGQALGMQQRTQSTNITEAVMNEDSIAVARFLSQGVNVNSPNEVRRLLACTTKPCTSRCHYMSSFSRSIMFGVDLRGSARYFVRCVNVSENGKFTCGARASCTGPTASLL